MLSNPMLFWGDPEELWHHIKSGRKYFGPLAVVSLEEFRMRIRVIRCHCDLKGEHEQLRLLRLCIPLLFLLRILLGLDQDNYSIYGPVIEIFREITHRLIRDVHVEV